MTTFDQSQLNHKSDFTRCKPGNVACPKCFGETEIILTPRDAEGWPLGPLKRMTCDFCDGAGEVPADKQRPLNVGKPEPQPPEPSKWGQPKPKDKWGKQA